MLTNLAPSKHTHLRHRVSMVRRVDPPAARSCGGDDGSPTAPQLLGCTCYGYFKVRKTNSKLSNLKSLLAQRWAQHHRAGQSATSAGPSLPGIGDAPGADRARRNAARRTRRTCPYPDAPTSAAHAERTVCPVLIRTRARDAP